MEPNNEYTNNDGQEEKQDWGETSKQDQGEEPELAPGHANATQQPLKELETALDLLKKSDDTSRFVGLALLKPVLEQELSQEEGKDGGKNDALLLRCWRAIPAKFLDGLLKAKPSEKTSREEANNMVGLAVAVMHAFMRLMDSHQTNAKFIGRVPLLMTNLRSSLPEMSTQIMEILHSLIMTPEGSSAIFHTDPGQVPNNGVDHKPSSWLFVTMLLVDIRSTIPSLQEKLHSGDYPAVSARLVRAYDITGAFIRYLVHCLERMLDGDGTAPMPIDLLMKIRVNISETTSLTIEYLRDRYDSSTAGAAGLHPDARSTNGESSSNPLPIAWDTSVGMFSDPLTLSQLSVLSLWLRDEENESLRKEAAGIMDVLLALYKEGDDRKALEEGGDSATDDGFRIFRSAVLFALEGIIETTDGVEAFSREDGWALLAGDLTNLVPNSQEHPRGIEIVRVLLAVLESGAAGPAKEEWMSLVALANSALASTSDEADLEFGIAVSQLAVELLVRAPRGLRNKNRQSALRLLRRAEALSMKDYANGDIEDGLDEVVEGLESLAMGSGES